RNYFKYGNHTIKGDNSWKTLLIKLDSAGQLQWFITSQGSGQCGTKDITVDGRNVYICGDIGGTVTFGDQTTSQPNGGVFLAKIVDDHSNLTAIYESQAKTNQFEIYPNPSSSIFQIKCQSDCVIQVINSLGKTILTDAFKEMNNKSIDLSNYTNGVYFIEITSNKKKEVKKIIKQ
ncbi:MAG: hypothetical protein JWO32_1727, partial [Bacteroidetes bacterium]|nr:hypothetical protein [Bacteroidota bacterium]